jgi:sulfatase maturation enzyme AslB (radical SAM superfamily)
MRVGQWETGMPSLEFTMMVGCPLKCTFCPQDGLRQQYGRNAKYFSLQDFHTVLSKVPKHVRIDFSGMAEPWANPDATAMLRHTLESGYNMAIYTTLYGMEDDDCQAAIEMITRHAAQMEVICLHLPDRNRNMRGWRYSPLYEANLRRFFALGMSGILPRFELMTMDSGGQPHADLDHLGLQLGAWVGHTRAGNVVKEAVSGQAMSEMPVKHGAVTCSFTPFYDQNVVLPNGDVVLCCMDYALQHKIGNLLQQGYYEMYASGGLARLISENMDPTFSRKSLCKTCDRARPYTVGPVKHFWQTT